jgi:hypothetical protein
VLPGVLDPAAWELYASGRLDRIFRVACVCRGEAVTVMVRVVD